MQMSEVTFSQLISDMLDIMPLDLHKVETLEVETLIVHGLQVPHDLMEVKLSDDLHPSVSLRRIMSGSPIFTRSCSNGATSMKMIP